MILYFLWHLKILSALTAFTDLVQPSTVPVPPSTNKIVWWLVLYSWSCLSKIISHDFLLCSTVIGLDLESHCNSREMVQFFETRLRIIFLALTWQDEIEITYMTILVFRDENEIIYCYSRVTYYTNPIPSIPSDWHIAELNRPKTDLTWPSMT